MWNMTFIMDTNVLHNHPDIVILNEDKKEAQIIDIVVPLDHNINQKTAEILVTTMILTLPSLNLIK